MHPCFRLEQNFTVDGRSSSEAWIKNVGNEKAARALAEKQTDTFIRRNRIKCEAILEPIYEQELCERFQKGICTYHAMQCYYKHFSCPYGDNCEDESCWLGHSERRTTASIDRPQYSTFSYI